MTFTLAIGDQITTREELNEAPPGTLLAYSDGRRFDGWQRRLNGSWEQVSGGIHHTDRIVEPDQIDLPATVRDLPIDGVPPLKVIKWHIRDGALNGAAAQGVSIETAQRALEASGAAEAEFPWSADQKVSNRVDLTRIPADSLVHVGRPTDIDKYTVYRADGEGGFKRLFGPGAEVLSADAQPAVWVDSISGAPPPGSWTTDPPASGKDVAAFKKRVWDAGLEAKQRHGWCETYEFVMERLGVTAESGEYHEPAVQADVLADAAGVVYAMRDAMDLHRWRLYVRVPEGGDEWGLAPLVTSSNGAPDLVYERLTRLGGHNEPCIFTTRQTIPNFEAFPVGTLVEFGRDRYQVKQDHLVGSVPRTTNTTDGAGRRGDYRPVDFGNTPCTILMFGRFA